MLIFVSTLSFELPVHTVVDFVGVKKKKQPTTVVPRVWGARKQTNKLIYLFVINCQKIMVYIEIVTNVQ